MTKSVCIEIAGVSFSLHSRNAEIPKVIDPAYTPFLMAERDASRLNVDIELEFGDIPSTKGVTRIFDTEQSWSMSFDGRYYYLSLNPPAHDGPLWLARFDNEFKRITVYCRQTPAGHPGKPTAFNPFSYPLDQILLMHILAQRGGAILHAGGIAVGRRGYIFPGRSGAGKSTLLRQFARRGNGCLLSDDRIVVRSIGNSFEAFGTPWPGEAGIAKNKSVPLRGIFFISHGTENRIEQVAQREALELLVPLVSVPWYDADTLTKVLIFCSELLSTVPACILHFKPDPDVADFLEEFISRQVG